MRQIMFRGKRVEGDEWIYGDLNHINGQVFVFDRSESAPLNSPDWFQVIPETIGQYTGLKDQKGVMIFEGDIIETDGSVSFSNYDSGKGTRREVFFMPSGFCGVRLDMKFDKENTSSAHNWQNYQLWNIQRSLTVIGNIHDNPELLIT